MSDDGKAMKINQSREVQGVLGDVCYYIQSSQGRFHLDQLAFVQRPEGNKEKTMWLSGETDIQAEAAAMQRP